MSEKQGNYSLCQQTYQYVFDYDLHKKVIVDVIWGRPNFIYEYFQPKKFQWDLNNKWPNESKIS